MGKRTVRYTVTEEVWRSFKAQAAADGRTVERAVSWAIECYAAGRCIEDHKGRVSEGTPR